MFIREASNYVGLTINQFRKYASEGKIIYKKSGIENNYDYNVDDIEKLKCFLNIICEYKNKNFNITILKN